MKKELFLVPGLLVVVATVQMYLCFFHHLTPWKGGGFGMFSTIDHLGTRGMSCLAVDQFQLEIPCQISFRGRGERGDLTKQRWRNLRALPSVSGLQSVLDDYYEQGKNAFKSVAGESYREFVKQTQGVDLGSEGARIVSLELKMWRLRFDSKSLKIWPEAMPMSAKRVVGE